MILFRYAFDSLENLNSGLKQVLIVWISLFTIAHRFFHMFAAKTTLFCLSLSCVLSTWNSNYKTSIKIWIYSLKQAITVSIHIRLLIWTVRVNILRDPSGKFSRSSQTELSGIRSKKSLRRSFAYVWSQLKNISNWATLMLNVSLTKATQVWMDSFDGELTVWYYILLNLFPRRFFLSFPLFCKRKECVLLNISVQVRSTRMVLGTVFFIQ